MMTKKHYDWLIVGAGFTGAVLAERLARQANKRVIVVDRRDHIGGNAYDRVNELGQLFHQYGPHVFHTNSAAVFDYLSQFTDWRPYEHRVVGLIEGRLVPIPFNLTSLNILFSPSKATELQDLLAEHYGLEQQVPILKMMQSTLEPIRDLSAYIYENVFLGYTRKQWGLDPDQLAPSVTARVPINISNDDRYFPDKYQAMPSKGYTALFQRMLDHPNIDVSLGTDFATARDMVSFERVVYTGAIDEFFDYQLGALPYRSLRFDFRTYSQGRHQHVGTVNYPNNQAFTRITEMAHLTGQWSSSTVVAVEYPQEHRPGETTPYYPVPQEANIALHRRYVDLAKREAANVIFAGRLGDYQYYNMDQAVGRSLSIFSKLELV